MAKYSKVEEAKVLDLIPQIINRYPEKFSHINADDIVLVFKECADSRWFGQTRLIKGVWKVVTDKAVLLSLWKNAWDSKSDSWRALLIYHELLHLGVDDVNGGYKIIKHDIEDFAEVIRTYGIDWENSDAFLTDLNQTSAN